MSLPREILDQLLSGYLDDSLSADERARVERLLETDPEVARELEELRGIGGWLKDVAKADASVTLPEGFSDRVLDAAIACAKSEGLSEEHPLVRLAEQPSMQPTASSNGSWRTAAALVALAATIVIAVFAFRPNTNPDQPDGPSVASNPNTPTVDPVIAPPVKPEVDDPSGTAIVAVNPKTTDPVGPSEVNPVPPETAKPPREVVATADPSVPDTLPKDPSNVGPTKVGPSKAGSDMVGVGALAKRGEIMVIDIRLTAKGRESQAMRQAMRAAGLAAESEKKITDEIVGLGQQAATDSEAQIIYLQAFGKSLDKLYLQLFEDREGIESIGLGVVQDAPLLGMVDAFERVDPTLVRHEVNWKLSSESNVVRALATDLSKRTYLPMSREDVKGSAAALSAANANSKGEDIPSQLILLVR